MMEDISALKSTGLVNDIAHKANVNRGKISHRRIGISPAIITLIAEGGLDFFRYLKRMGMSGENNLIVLSSKHHYYCEENDLKNVRILVNLRKLNLIKHLGLFFNSLVRILPPDTNFIGYFSDNKDLDGSGLRSGWISRLFHRLNNFLSSGADQYMNRREVTELLERNGFEVVNMTRINGLTYFYSHNTHRPVELKD